MVTFSVNALAADCSVPEEMKEIIEKSLADSENRASMYCEYVGDMYLRMVDRWAGTPLDRDVMVKSYIIKSKQNNDYNDLKKYVPILSNEEMEDDESVKGPAVSENVLKFVDENFETVEERMAFDKAVVDLLKLAKIVEVEDNIDLVLSMYAALDGNAKAISHIKAIKDKYNASDIFMAVLSGPWTKYISKAC